MPTKYTVTETTITPWIEAHECIRKYISKLNAAKNRKAQDIFIYCQFAAKHTDGKVTTPEDLLALKTDYVGGPAEELLESFTTAKPTDLGIPATKHWQIMVSVRGFYRVNMRALQQEAGRMEAPTAKDKPLTSKENRCKLFKACYTPRDKVIIALSTVSAIAEETQTKLRWSHFEPDWESHEVPHISIESAILKGHDKGKYRGVRQETFLTPEAKLVLIEYRDWYARNFSYTWKPNDPVLMDVRGNVGKGINTRAFAAAVENIADRAGVDFTSHDGRDLVQTALENCGVVRNQIQKIKGRKVRGEDAPYSKPEVEKLRQRYLEAVPDLEFLNPSNGSEKADEVKSLKEKVAKLEGAKPALEALLRRVEELEEKLK